MPSENAFHGPTGISRLVRGGFDQNLRDDELIADVLAGDRKAIALFVETYTDVVYNFLSHRMDRVEAVEDSCQEVFLAAWAELANFRNESSLKTWLCAIARHKVADYYRRRLQEAPQIDGDEEGEVAHPEATQVFILDLEGRMDRQRVDARVRKVLLGMREDYRAILRWRYWEHCPLGEIAGMTGKSEKAVERLLARARADFAKRWNIE